VGTLKYFQHLQKRMGVKIFNNKGDILYVGDNITHDIVESKKFCKKK
jgi:FMN phosphatase YigB (HAD superfamily)